MDYFDYSRDIRSSGKKILQEFKKKPGMEIEKKLWINNLIKIFNDFVTT